MTAKRFVLLVAAGVLIAAGAGVALLSHLWESDPERADAGPRVVQTPSSTTDSPSCAEDPDVVVTNAPDLQPALDSAEPGMTIRLQDGQYDGEYVINRSGTPDAPIELCGSRKAVLDGGPIDGGYTLHLDGAAHWRLVGFSVTGGQKGVMADGAVGNLIDSIAVHDVGDEGIHLRTFSTDNVVTGTEVFRTGLREPDFGEGLYVGTAESNWCELTECEPDRSDRNVLRNNVIHDTTAESIDLKEGTSDGVVESNVMDGGGMEAADSWIDVKGNGWSIVGNRGVSSPLDGIQVHQILEGWGQANRMTGNDLVVDAAGYGINVTVPDDDNVVACDNAVTGAAEGLASIDCT